MEHFVTLFDSFYLPQGLALHLSMQRHIPVYTLWIICVDDEVFRFLTQLKLANVRLLELSKIETEELLSVKAKRTIGEYCWTLTPFSPRFVFEADDSVQRVTYLDADLWFRKNPSSIFQEFNESGKSVLMTDHAYAPEYDQSATSGQFCVQFMTFERGSGEIVRQWWEARCLEWCHAWYEDGKFGDQKYLDDWPERFAQQVHVLIDKELMLAPWNATRFPYGRSVCWHFQDLRIVKGINGNMYGIDCGTYPLPLLTRQNIYQKYAEDLSLAIKVIIANGGDVKEQRQWTTMLRVKAFLAGFSRQFWRTSIHCYLPL